MMKNTPSGVQGVGTDIIEIGRIREAYMRHGKRFLLRVFTPEERNYCTGCADPTPRLAGRFAAKEAIAKTFGTGIGTHIEWKEIEIVNDSKGKPEVMLSPRLRRLFPNINILLSISHCRAYATAVAIRMDY